MTPQPPQLTRSCYKKVLQGIGSILICECTFAPFLLATFAVALFGRRLPRIERYTDLYIRTCWFTCVDHLGVQSVDSDHASCTHEGSHHLGINLEYAYCSMQHHQTLHHYHHGVPDWLRRFISMYSNKSLSRSTWAANRQSITALQAGFVG